jgi:hypothetical protein
MTAELTEEQALKVAAFGLDQPEIQAWETEDAIDVVWGTHDPALAERAWTKYLNDDCGLHPSDAYYQEARIAVEEWATARRSWARPDGPETEVWTDDMHSNEPVDGWVPYLVVAR